MNNIISWLLQNGVGILGIVIGGFISYHVYFLSKKLDLRDKLLHKDTIRTKVELLLNKVRKGGNSDSELVNIKKYFTHYPNSNEKDLDGYTYLKAELKGLKFDGVEFFCGVRSVFKKKDGSLSLKQKDGLKREEFNLLEAGTIPYEWIEYVDVGGDEFSFRPQFFTKFKGLDKSPYKYLTYYKENKKYDKRSEPMEFQWIYVDVESQI